MKVLGILKRLISYTEIPSHAFTATASTQFK